MTRSSMKALLAVAGTAGMFLSPVVPVHGQEGFRGKIGDTIAQSEPDFETPVRAAAGSPNVIYVLLDDTGFGDLGAYGSEIATPHIDGLARDGLVYNNFHTRAVCSPSRAALLTGRNSHSVGVGNLSNIVNGFPGKRGSISHASATVAELLRASGYSTFMVGKWHNTGPLGGASSVAEWPVQRGFDRFYGFHAMTDQFHPELMVDNTVLPPHTGSDYNLNEDLIDHSLQMIASHIAVAPDKPFFLYLAPGATHAPHQVQSSYIEKYRGRYDAGWDAIRAERFRRQQALGIVPQGTRLPLRDSEVQPWSSLNPAEKKIAARMQEAYAGFLEQTDHEIGRLLAFLDKANLRDNTLIVLMSDNGASREGEETGTTNLTYNITNFARKSQGEAELLARLDEIGTERSYGNYPLGWAMASNTPFRNFKHSVQAGGVRAPMILSWPGHVRGGGQVRQQFVDIMDITPTVLKAAQATLPEMFNGVRQMPLEGADISATFRDPRAPDPRSVQYFELWGNRAIWSKGWMAYANHRKGTSFGTDQWQLFDVGKDFSASTDLAARHSAKVEEMKRLWWEEARKYKVLPLDDRAIGEFSFGNPQNGITTYTFYPETGTIPFSALPNLSNRSFAIRAMLNRKSAASNGVVMASGDRFGGFSVFVQDGYLNFAFNDFGKQTRVVSERSLPAGPVKVEIRFRKQAPFAGTVELLADGEAIGVAPLAMTPAGTFTWAGTDIGYDAGSPVSDAYAQFGAFPFPKGELDKIEVELLSDPPG